MDPIGVGIIGLGVGRRQAEALLTDRRVEKIVLCDVDEQRLKTAAKELNVAETTTDWHSLVKRDDLHLISVASPDHLHAEMAVASLRAGKHVLCEKPMASNLEEAREIVRAVEETGMKLQVNNVLRFYPRFQRVKQLVEEGTLGRIYAAEGDYLHNTLHLIEHGWRGPHRHSVMTGGGVHLIDLLLWMIGDVEEAFCYASRAVLSPDVSRSPECMLAVLRFANGCVAKSMTNMAVQRPALHNLILYGTSGVFINGRPDGILYRGHKSGPEPITDTYGPADSSTGQKGVGMANLLDCIERDEEPLVNVREGARAVAVCDAIYESMCTGKPAPVQNV